MKTNLKKIIFSLIFSACLFLPTHALAATYSVEMVSSSTNNQVVGTYSTYNAAVNAMNAQTSSATKVAAIYKNGVIINAKYAIFQFKVKSSSSTVYLYQNAGDTTSYTYTAPAYMTDAAFIGANESRANIMLNGFNGWVDINEGNIIPISLMSGGSKVISVTASGLRLRSNPSTSASILTSITCTNTLFTYLDKKTADGYTWYKITYNGTTGWIAGSSEWLTETNVSTLNTYYYRYSTGNLLHRYGRHNGTSYTDDYTNLGPTPSYLQEGVHYYSFDGGIYLYTDLVSMLGDYQNNTYEHSLNKNNPNYPYYLFLPGRAVSKITASELNAQITNPKSKLYGQGVYFKEAESLYGMNALSAFATAKNESADGMSQIAQDKNNVFGYGASDSCPYSCAKSYASVRDSIMDYAQNGLSSYMTAQNKYYFGSHAGTKGSGRNVMYASDPLWGEKQAWNAYMSDKGQNLRDYKANTIAVSKYGKYNLPVYKNANTSTIIYYMKNQNGNHKVYNVPVNVIDKIGDFYKIYADSSTYQYGYVKVSDFNITNNQPVINASNRTINLNSTFKVLEGVSATDTEDGNLTSRIKTTGTVDTSKLGTYDITYTVTDNSNYSCSKTITVTVIGEANPTLEASNKEIVQFDEFDPLEGVTAKDYDGTDLTNEITYEGEVDTNTVGEYEITYSVTNSANKTATKTIIVKVIKNEEPVITANDKTAYLNREFNPLEGVTATDKEDGDLTSKITVKTNTVNTEQEGEYSVTYEVSDNNNQKTTKTITVTVVEKIPEKAQGLFYLDYIKEVNGKLQIKGYNTIAGIDNTLETNISYKIKYINLDTNDEYYQEAERITNTIEMPKTIYSVDGKDYTYSWFKINIDFSTLPLGNYKMYVISENEDYYSENIINNKLSKPLASNIVQNDKTIVLRRNYSYEGSPVELIIRNNNFAKKTSGTYYNQFDKYTKFEFNDENMLYLRGVSYSYGMDLAPDKTIQRKIIFENSENYEPYIKDLGSITTGNYNVVLPENDNFNKTRAWYNATIDLSDIPKGHYVIYITTSSNVTDIYEMTEKMGRSLENVVAQIEEKNYSFTINRNRGNRIEMNVN